MVFRIDRFELDLKDPLTSANEVIKRRRGFLVRYGLGVGEATPLPPWTESYEETARALDWLAAEQPSPGSALERFDVTPAARHALSSALVDHWARERGVALYRYLGGKRSLTSVPVNATVDAGDPSDVRAAMEQVTDAGYPAVKLKIGIGDRANDLERIDAAASVLPAELAFRLDANGAYDLSGVLAVVPHLATLGIDYIEQPTPGVDADLIEQLQSDGLGVAIDEGIRTVGLIEALRANPAAIIIKPMAFGGPDLAKAAALAARSLGIEPVISDLITGAVGRITAGHVAASLGDPAPAGLDTGRRLDEDIVVRPPLVSAGHFELPSGAGLGIEVP